MTLSCLFLTFHLGMAWGAVGAPVRVQSTTEAIGERDAGLVQARHTITLLTATVDYRTVYRQDDTRTVVEKTGEQLLGLSLGRRLGNGGWNIWRFLRVQMKSGDRSFDGTAVYTPRGIAVLEAQPRAMVELAWPLDATSEDAELAVRLLQSPGLSEWLFLRIEIKGGGGVPQTVQLSCYPGNTSGPAVRERWLLSGGREYTLHNGAVSLQQEADGILFFNRYAQERDGCLLVWLPAEVKTVSAAGTYGVQTTVTPQDGVRILHFALGCYNDIAWQDAARTFGGEQASQVRQLLAATRWEPEMDRKTPLKSLQEIQTLLERTPLWPELPGTTVSLAGCRSRNAATEETLGERYARLQQELAAAAQPGAERIYAETVTAITALRDDVFAAALGILQ